MTDKDARIAELTKAWDYYAGLYADRVGQLNLANQRIAELEAREVRLRDILNEILDDDEVALPRPLFARANAAALGEAS